MRADTTVALLVFLCLAAAAAVLAAPAVASHGDDADFTVQPEDPASDRAPGASGATYDMFVEVEESHENLTMIQYRLPEKAFSDCTADDLREFGIDRGNTHSGLETDEQPPAIYKEFDGYYFRYSVNGSFDLSAGDELVASISNCLYNPEEEGWYQGQVYLTDEDDSIRLQTKSHYYWICACEDESEARERLGPPPSENSTTPTPTPTQEPVASQESTPEPTSEPTPERTSEPTPTPGAPSTATSTPPADGTREETEGGQANTSASSPSDDATTATATAAGTSQPEQTATATGDDSAAVQSAEDDGTTPGGGPGFGALVAVLALTAAALLARRQD